MNLVLDTSALWDRPLRDALCEAKVAGLTSDGRLTVVIPAIAYGERLRQLDRDGRDTATWKERILDMGATVEPFSEAEASRLARADLDDGSWRRHARDALIAAHVTRDRVAVTPDRGPVWSRVATLTPEEATRAVRAMLGGH